jgi:UDP-2,4-diacetamido-2,4,6-trideoxy-beta-L-altropyranose hydrolase
MAAMNEEGQGLHLRPATAADAALLLAWRNDEATRLASHNTEPVHPEDHARWIDALLRNPARRLFIAEASGEPVGSVRADRDEDGSCHELSWTVAPAARGRGIGACMVRLLLAEVSGPVRAEVKPGNPASVRIAEAAGLCFEAERDGLMHFGARRRP